MLVESQAETVIDAEQPIPLHDDGLDPHVPHERSEVRFGCNGSIWSKVVEDRKLIPTCRSAWQQTCKFYKKASPNKL